MPKLTQAERILRLLKQRGKDGVKVWEIAMPINQGGLGVMQYNARIYELRRQGHRIVNKEPGHFVLETEKPKRSFVEMMGGRDLDGQGVLI